MADNHRCCNASRCKSGSRCGEISIDIHCVMKDCEKFEVVVAHKFSVGVEVGHNPGPVREHSECLVSQGVLEQ